MKQILTLKHPTGEASWADGPVRIGRSPDNQLVVTDESLSRHHAEINPTRHGWVVRDLQSANGIWVDGVRVPTHRIKKGDVITLGSVPLTISEAVVAKLSNPAKLRVGLAAGILVMGGLLLVERQEAEVADAWKSPDARIFEARVPPPPTNLTAERAVEFAKRYYTDNDRSGEALADARRALAWSRLLNNDALPKEAQEINALVEKALEERFRQGKVAYLRAKKLGDKRAAEAAMRMLRETFPYDDPRSLELNRMEHAR